MAFTFSCTGVSAPRGKYVSGARTRSCPPVTFRHVRRLPCASRMILNTRAPNSSGYSGGTA